MPHHILVVDDEPHFELMVRKAFRREITREEYRFQFARNGIEALEVLSQETGILLVVTDINMPRMNGLSLLEKLNEKYPLLRTVVVTAYADMSNIRAAMNAGAFDFLVKPIGLDDFRKTVRRALDHVIELREMDRIRTEKEAARKSLLSRLQRLDRLKDEFLANVSHELNTPLNGILGIAESLVDGIAGDLPKPARQNLGLVISSATRLSALVHDLLDFSNLKNGELKLDRRAVRVAPVIEAVLSLSKPMLDGKPVTLVYDVDEGLPAVLADETRLEQILYNLVGNAIKFTEKGSVTVRAVAAEKMIEVSVLDTGIGIPEDKLEVIFNSFEQVDGKSTRRQGGTGLGLAITRKLVQLQGGAIEVRSKVGEGSRFLFTLPISQDARTSDTEQKDSVFSLDSGKYAPAPAVMVLEDSGRDDRRGASRCRILVADDEPVNRQLLANQLTLDHHEVVTVANGTEALEILEQDPNFDLVLLDVMMPGMSGFDVCRRIRERFSLFDLPILFLTAKRQPRDFIEGLRAGANDYLAKPFDKRELMARSNTLLTLKRAVGDAITKARRLEAERQNREIAENLRRMMEQLNVTLDMEEVAKRFLDHVAEQAPFDRAMLTLRNRKSLEIIYTRGYKLTEATNSLPRMYLPMLNEEFFGERCQARQPQVINKPSEDVRFSDAVSPDVRSWLLIPFFTHGEAGGLLLLERFYGGFEEHEVQMVLTFAGQAAMTFENASLFSKVRMLATTDELTGLHNRRNFFSLARMEFQRSCRYGQSLAAIMLDIDHFKRFNDSFGHAVGDEVLRSVAFRVRKTCRESDIVGRYGGEEFAILLPAANLEMACEAAERLRVEVCDALLELEDGQRVSTTISLGVASLDESVETLETLVRRADEALYLAKKRGRNRVVALPEEPASAVTI